MDIVTIRMATEQDIPFLWEMLYESLYIPEGEESPGIEIIKHPAISKYVEDWGRDGDNGFIAVNEFGQSIGSITIRYYNKENKGYGYVNDETPELGMAIRSEYRGKGIGTQLLGNLIEHARSIGMNTISLSVNPNNSAMKLYKRFGFKEVGTVETSVTMLLTL